MSVRIAVFNQKGGTGKTTVAVNLAAALAELSKEVLVVDLDGQESSLTAAVGIGADIHAKAGDNIFSMLVDMEGDPNALILRAPHDEFDVLPGHVKMSQAEGKLGPERNREWRLARVLKAIRKPYDFILVDCPPGTGAVSDNALLACQRVLAPAEMHEAFMPSISGVMMQLRSLSRIFEVAVDMVGFVPVAYRGTPDEVAYLDALKAERPAWVTPCLRYRKAIMNASRAAGHSVFSYRPTKRHRKAPLQRCQEEYRELAAHVMQKIAQEGS